jgi:hypothetical protein
VGSYVGPLSPRLGASSRCGWRSRPPDMEGKKVKISLLQAVEAPRFARGRGSHIT